jgi:small subunit ribosomal protein S9
METKEKFTPHLAGESEPQSEGRKSLNSSPSKQGAGFIQKTGRRKTATARVRLVAGKGDVIINEKNVNDYFSDIYNALNLIKEPLALVGFDKKLDISVNVRGGGKKSQIEAIRLGIARVLISTDEKLKTTLKKAGFLTRDSRMKERKKYGLKRAHKAPQYRKR